MRRLWFDRFQIAEDAPLAQAEAKWTSRFEELLGRADEEAAHVLGVLVGLPFADSPHIGAMRDDPSQLKGRALVVSRELLGAEHTVTMPNPIMGAEDFSYVLERLPGAMCFLGATPAGRNPLTAAPNHSNRVVFDEQAMVDGMAMYAGLAIRHLAPAAP